jgi:protocatechuate 3,4-dioxygenase beta subunit
MTIIKHLPTTYLVVILLSFNACSQSAKRQKSDLEISVPDQNNSSWSGAFEAPINVSWRTIIPPKSEPGEKLIISGTVYFPDGKTPAKDVIVYVYHTNNEGIYPKKGNEQGHGKYHGYLRGWMKTDASGKYEFETIRPAPYETHDGEPAHIHYTLKHPDYPEYWLTGLWFSDDPRVSSYLDKIERDGGLSNITTLTKDKNNILRGTRNIILQKFSD